MLCSKPHGHAMRLRVQAVFSLASLVLSVLVGDIRRYSGLTYTFELESGFAHSSQSPAVAMPMHLG